MQQGLRGVRVAVVAADGAEAAELAGARGALEAAGATLETITPDADPARYEALLLAGDAGPAGAGAASFVRRFAELDRPIAAIGAGASVLIEADVVRGRTLTSAPALRAQIEQAGGTWVDRQVQVDQKLVTSRTAADLPAFGARIVRDFAVRTADDKLDAMVEQSFPASDPLPSGLTIGDAPPPAGEGSARPL